MLTIQQTNCASTGELLDRALDTIEFYGFNPLDKTLKDKKPAKVLKVRANANLALPIEKKLSSLTKSFVSHGFHREDFPHFEYQVESGAKVSSLSLHAVGSKSSIAEAMLISTLENIARESGLQGYVLHINSIGDKDSSARYIRDLTAYLRNNLNEMPGYAREDMQAGNPVRAFSKLSEKQNEIAGGAPNPMEYLNDESRAHLRTVLEYVENIGIPYELDTSVLGSNDCWQHTIFELRIPNESGGTITVARGGRHDSLAYKSYRVEMPVVSVIIEHEIRGRIKPKRRATTDPKFFFAQLGPQAKMKSFSVLELLRKSGVPISQQLALESIGAQLEKVTTPYTVIIGHKEALEETAIVRNMNTMSQVVVPLSNLSSYLKRLKA